ncbi:MAG: glutathione S-transferase family protein [Caulobacterales bacterium]
MLKVWARRSSSSAQKVYWLLGELQIPHEQIDAGRSFGVVGTPEYLAKNPNGLVPTIEEEDGWALWESHAIIRYLAAKAGSEQFYPSDLRARAEIDRWIDWTSSTAIPAINPIFGRLVMQGGPADPAFVNAQIIASKKVLTIVSDVVAGQAYLAGDDLTLADIPFGMILHRWFTLPIERPSLPLVDAYYERLRTRPAYLQHVVNAPPVV